MKEEPQDLVTGGEIGRRLGVSRERVRQLAQRSDFPAPIGRLGQANVWGWAAVDEWLRKDGRVPPVEIYSATDSPHVPDPQVWYWVEWGEGKFEKTTDYAVALRQAERICEEHDTAIIDRSDKGSGILRATLGRR
jgi:predicted DNA-binding transcriptional regulator AlpA